MANSEHNPRLVSRRELLFPKSTASEKDGSSLNDEGNTENRIPDYPHANFDMKSLVLPILAGVALTTVVFFTRRRDRENPQPGIKVETAVEKAARLAREAELKENPSKYPNALLPIDQTLSREEAFTIGSTDTDSFVFSSSQIRKLREGLRRTEQEFRREMDGKIGFKNGTERERTIWEIVSENTCNEEKKPIPYELSCIVKGSPEQVYYLQATLEADLVTEKSPGNFVPIPGVYIKNKPYIEGGKPANQRGLAICLGQTPLRELYSAEPLPPLESLSTLQQQVI